MKHCTKALAILSFCALWLHSACAPRQAPAAGEVASPVASPAASQAASQAGGSVGGPAPRPVQAVAVRRLDWSEELKAFGSLVYDKKITITAPQDGLIASLSCREAERVESGSVLLRIQNPALETAVTKARQGMETAAAAVRLARARLREARAAIESRLLAVDKAVLELAQARASHLELERQLADQEALYAAGGLSLEQLRASRFGLESSAKAVLSLELDLAMRQVGLRPEDLEGAGRPVPTDPQRLRLATIDLNLLVQEAELQAAQTAEAIAEEDWRLASAMLSSLSLRAPIDAVVVARQVEVGERVKRDDPLLTLVNSDSLYAQFPVAEAEAAGLRVGQAALVWVEALAAEYRGEVAMIAPVADSRSASFAVRVRLEAAAAGLSPGLFVRVRLPRSPEASILCIPESALVERQDDRAIVMVIQQQRAYRRSIELGRRLDAGLEVRAGLRDGELVVDRPGPFIEEGSYVSPGA